MGIKLSRVLTAHHEAFGADRVGLSGVKFDKLGKTTSRQPIFSVDKETAREIRATFVIDLSLIRSFGRGEHGLNNNQKQFLLELALWKIGRLLSGPYRFRSGCDLKLTALARIENGKTTEIPATALQHETSRQPSPTLDSPTRASPKSIGRQQNCSKPVATRKTARRAARKMTETTE